MMWELIAANRRKSLVLFIGMAAVLCTLGYLIGQVVSPDGGGTLGVIFAVAVWMGLSALSIFGGGSIVLRMAGAKQVDPDVHPQLYNIVEEMKIASGLNHMPRIYIIDEKAPNAFATGLNPKESTIAVTAGLLARLDRDELQGVIAHETAHIVNRDMQFMTLASIMLGTIVILSEVFLRGMWLSGGGSSRRYRSGKGGGGVHPAIAVAAIILAILGPVFARLLYFAISRKREYLADACAARFTRYPEGLARALEKISASPFELSVANKATAPMYIVNPFRDKKRALSGLSATHPPAAERIAILRAMSGGAGLLSYQRAYSKVKGKPSMIIPTSGLRKDKQIDVREPHPDAKPVASETKKQARDVMDLMRAVNGYAFLICACGLKIKVPPDFEGPHVSCPRCKRENQIPRAATTEIAETAAVVGAVVGALGAGSDESDIPVAREMEGGLKGKKAPLQYTRRSKGWESFSCMCGNMLQLSPAFNSRQMKCRKCGRLTRIN